MVTLIAFQSTHPLRGATILASRKEDQSKFQSTHPLRGATVLPCGCPPSQADFNPRTPCGVRPIKRSKLGEKEWISIHAPLAGCDYCKDRNQQSDPTFQSTHPLRGATNPHYNDSKQDIISIHAPLAGCDCSLFRFLCLLYHFNPRTPCGVRPSVKFLSCSIIYFNPRTPCGVRHCRCTG